MSVRGGAPRPSLPRTERPALPLTSQDYYGFLRTERYRWWKGLLGIVLLVAGLLVLSALLGAAGLAVDVARGDVRPDQVTAEALARGELVIGPAFYIANNLAVAALIPLSMLVNRLLFGQRARWLSSVQGRFRWRWLLWCLLVVGVPWVGILVLLTAIAPGTSLPVTLSAAVLVLLGLTLVTTPLQAAGEEWAFRGFVPRCIGAMVPDARAGVVVSALVSAALFMALHFAFDPWLNLFYFCLGLVFSALTWRTGGLEAAVTLHAVNNLAILVPVVLTDQLGAALDRSAGSGHWVMPLLPLLLGTGLVLVADRVARRRGLERAAAPGLSELAPPPADHRATARPAVPPAGGPGFGDSENVDPRVTLETYEHRDDPQPGTGDRRP